MDYLNYEFHNLYCAWQLFLSIENRIGEYIFKLVDDETKTKINSIYIESDDDGFLNLFIDVFTLDVNEVFDSLTSTFDYDFYFKKVCDTDFSKIILRLDDNVVDNLVFQ